MYRSQLFFFKEEEKRAKKLYVNIAVHSTCSLLFENQLSFFSLSFFSFWGVWGDLLPGRKSGLLENN